MTRNIANLDRFDRMELAAAQSRAAIVAPTVLRQEAPIHRGIVETPIVKRGSRFVDHTHCPMCGVDNLGVTYQGLRANGDKIHELTAHSAGKRRVGNGEVRCLGAGMRMIFVEGSWRGEPAR